MQKVREWVAANPWFAIGLVLLGVLFVFPPVKRQTVSTWQHLMAPAPAPKCDCPKVEPPKAKPRTEKKAEAPRRPATAVPRPVPQRVWVWPGDNKPYWVEPRQPHPIGPSPWRWDWRAD